MDRWEAQYEFWSGFGVPAYEQNSVPDKDHVVFPYITYEAVSSSFNGDAYPSVSIWTKSTSWKDADNISDTIQETIEGGHMVPHDSGAIWYTTNDPFSTSMGDPNDDLVKRKLLSITAHFV